MVIKQRINKCFINRKWHLYDRDVYCDVYRSSVAQTPLMVAGPGIEPRTEDYESSVIPFYYPATFVYSLNLLVLSYIQKLHLQP